jgi:beta-lactamase class D
MNRCAAILLFIALAGSPGPVLALCASSTAVPPERVPAFEELRRIAFLSLDLASGHCVTAGDAALDRRHPPWSTFKIPHFLIALETGATTPDEVFERDADRFPAEPWWSEAWRVPQDPATALRRSTAWVYRTLTDRIAAADYAHWLANFDDGNRDIGEARDDFWLGGPLAISVREQVAFVAALLRGETGVSPAAIEALERPARQNADFPLAVFGKTGAGPLREKDFDGPFEGWFVGWLREENGRPVAVFALHAQADSFGRLASARRAAALSFSRQLHRP